MRDTALLSNILSRLSKSKPVHSDLRSVTVSRNNDGKSVLGQYARTIYRVLSNML